MSMDRIQTVPSERRDLLEVVEPPQFVGIVYCREYLNLWIGYFDVMIWLRLGCWGLGLHGVWNSNFCCWFHLELGPLEITIHND